MNRNIEGGNGFWVWTGALVFALLLYGTPQTIKNGLSSVVRDGIYAPFAWVNSQYRLLRDNLYLRIRMERELTKARLELQQLRELRVENQRLRNLLEFKERSDFKLVLAEVVGYGEPGYPFSFVITAGINRGIAQDAPVLTAEGLVGKVRLTSSRTSIVQMLFDPGLHVAVLDQRSRAIGILSAKDGQGLIMEQVPTGEDIAEGDKIITSGLGGVFPKGLLVGHVVSVLAPPNSMFKKISIQPAAQLNRLEEVFVLTDFRRDFPEPPTDSFAISQ